MTDEEFMEIKKMEPSAFYRLPSDKRFEWSKERDRRDWERFLALNPLKIHPSWIREDNRQEDGRCVDAFQYQNECGGYNPSKEKGIKEL